MPNYTGEAVEKDVLLSASGMADGRLSFLLPEGMAALVPDLPEPCGQTPSLPGSADAVALPRALADGLVALGATERLWVGDQARIEEPGGAFSEVENMGSAATEIGASAKVGSVTSVASVFLRSNATVEGDVTTEGTITKQNDVTVSGVETAAADLPPASSMNWPGPPTDASQGPVMLEPDTSRTLTPGAYGQVSVKTGATLTLEGGVYRFGSLDALELGSVLVANTDAEPVTLYVEGSVTVRGAIVDTAMDGSGALIVMLGTGWATLESPFHGTLVAPYGTISLGTAGGRRISAASSARRWWWRPTRSCVGSASPASRPSGPARRSPRKKSRGRWSWGWTRTPSTRSAAPSGPSCSRSARMTA